MSTKSVTTAVFALGMAVLFVQCGSEPSTSPSDTAGSVVEICEVPPTDVARSGWGEAIEQLEWELETTSIFGGAWGMGEGGIVLAVTDCEAVDEQRVSDIAGGPDLLRLIEVPYTMQQVEDFRDDLVAELQSSSAEGDVLVDSTPMGKVITVAVLDPALLPSDFGARVPTSIWSVQQVDSVFQNTGALSTAMAGRSSNVGPSR